MAKFEDKIEAGGGSKLYVEGTITEFVTGYPFRFTVCVCTSGAVVIAGMIKLFPI